MNSRRMAKLAAAVRETVSTTVLFGLRDPRIRNVTVIGAEVSADLRFARIRVSIMGDDKQQQLCLHGLNSARGFLQSKIADRLQTRYTPLLQFEIDEGAKRSAATSRTLKKIFSEDGQPDSSQETSSESLETRDEKPAVSTPGGHAHTDCVGSSAEQQAASGGDKPVSSQARSVSRAQTD